MTRIGQLIAMTFAVLASMGADGPGLDNHSGYYLLKEFGQTRGGCKVRLYKCPPQGMREILSFSLKGTNVFFEVGDDRSLGDVLFIPAHGRAFAILQRIGHVYASSATHYSMGLIYVDAGEILPPSFTNGISGEAQFRSFFSDAEKRVMSANGYYVSDIEIRNAETNKIRLTISIPRRQTFADGSEETNFERAETTYDFMSGQFSKDIATTTAGAKEPGR